MIGDVANVLKRLRAVLPQSWFPKTAPVLDATLTGGATLASDNYSRLQFVKAQMRIPTSTGIWLDLAAWDFFGPRFLRIKNQSDAQFAAAIVAEIFRPRVTRKAVVNAVEALTGRDAKPFEPFNVRDTGGLGMFGALGAGQFGLGNRRRHGEAYLHVLRPLGQGIRSHGGLGSQPGILRMLYGLGRRGGPAAAWGHSRLIGENDVVGVPTTNDVLKLIHFNKAAGIVTWTDIVSSTQEKAIYLLNEDWTPLMDDFLEALIIDVGT